MAMKFQSYDGQDPTLFDVHLELPSLPIADITETTANPEESAEPDGGDDAVTFNARNPRAALELMVAQAQHYLDEITDGDLSPHAEAVTAAKAFQKLSGTLVAGKSVAVTAAYVTADEQLNDPDAEFGAHRPHPDNPDAHDRWITRSAATAAVLGATLNMPLGVARGLIARSNRLVQHLPHAFARVACGDWSDWDLKVALDALAPLTDAQAAEADTDLHATAGPSTAAKIRRRINRWITQRKLQPVEDQNEKVGIENRRADFGPVDLFGMRPIYLYLPATDVTAIETSVHDYARHAPDDDPRTPDQIHADVVRTMLFGPAALTAEAAAQLEFAPITYDDTNTPLTREREQYEQAQDAWAAILLLMSTLGMTIPAPPRAMLNVDVPLSVLLQLRAGMMPGTGPHAPPDGECPTCGHTTNTTGSTGSAGCAGSPGLDGHSGAGAPSAACPERREERAPVEGLDQRENPDNPDNTCPDAGCADAGWDVDARGWVHGLGRIGWRELLRLLNGSPDLRRIVTDDLTGAPIDIGPRIKNPPAAMRERVQHRDKTCRFPGCDGKAIRESGRSADLDHINPHRTDGTGGNTADANLQCLCRNHHTAKHHLKWRVVMHEDGTITWHSEVTGATFAVPPGE